MTPASGPVGRNAVVCITDRNYLLPTKVLLASLQDHLSPDVEIYVLSRDVTSEDFSDVPFRERLTGVIDYSGYRVFREIEETGFRGRTHVTGDAKAKLQLPFMFPEHNRVLYLDVDMVCCSSQLNELFTLDLEGNLLAAVPDYKMAKHPFRAKIGVEDENFYFNSGLVLFDIQQCLESLTEQLVIDRTATIASLVRFVDQDTLNYIYRNRVLYLPKKYNVFANVHIGNDVTRSLEQLLEADDGTFLAFPKEELESAMRERVILHYTSSAKPWKTSCGHEDLWWSICDGLSLGVSRHDRKPKLHNLKSRSKRPLSRIRKLFGTPLSTLRRALGGTTDSRLSRQIEQLEKGQTKLAKDLEGASRAEVRYPVLLDLSWARSSGDLQEELRCLFAQHTFLAGCDVLVDQAFSNRLHALSASWSVRFHVSPQDLWEGYYFRSKVFYPKSADLAAEYLSVLNGEAPETSACGEWLRVTQEGLTVVNSGVPRALGVSFLKEHSAPRYDPAITALYKSVEGA